MDRDLPNPTSLAELWNAFFPMWWLKFYPPDQGCAGRQRQPRRSRPRSMRGVEMKLSNVSSVNNA